MTEQHHFETLNRVHLSDAEFSILMDMIVSGDLYEASAPFAILKSWSGMTAYLFPSLW